jgi:hypothetical protein
MSAMPDSSASPWATRLRRPRWTDPRLLVGLVLVAVAAVAGTRVVAAADDTVPVWSVSDAVRAGDQVRAGDLVVTRVRIADGAGNGLYLPAAAAAPAGVFTRDLAAGELVPVSGVADAVAGGGAELPLAVQLGDAPADLAAGELVDVWAVPADSASPASGASPRTPASRVLAGVVVVSVAEPAAGLGGAARQVLLEVDSSPDQLGEPLSRLSGGRVVLVRVGG